MAPPKAQNSNAMKQKSLMGWLSAKPTTSQPKPNANEPQKSKEQEKAGGNKTSSAANIKDTKGSRTQMSNADAASTKVRESTSGVDVTKGVMDKSDASRPTSSPPDAKALGSSSVASASDGHGKDTPPTSDAVDVDMLSDEDVRPLKTVRYLQKVGLYL
jgi:DNA mismatch repair protein MSH6